MNRIPPLAAVLLASVVTVFPVPVSADTIVLKSGERIEATILNDSSTSIEAEVKVSPSISDTRTFSKEDILRIEKPDPAEAVYESFAPLGNNPNSISFELYLAAITGKLQPFLKNHPTSTRIPDVEALLNKLQSEKERVAKGHVKVENEWFTPEEVEKFKPQISSALLFQKMRSLSQTGDFIGALNTFSQLEKDYPGSPFYPKAVELAIQLLPNVQKEINARRIILKSDLEEREKGIAVLPDFRKQPLLDAAAAEEAQNNATIESLQKSGQTWTPILPRHAKSIEELQKTVTAEATRLAAIPLPAITASVAATQEARKQIAQGDYEAATIILQKASTLWNANSLIKTFQDDITAAKEAEVAAAKAAEEAAKATPTPTALPASTPVGTAPSGAATPAIAATTAVTNVAATPAVAAATPTPVPTSLPTPAPEVPPSFFLPHHSGSHYHPYRHSFIGSSHFFPRQKEKDAKRIRLVF